MIIVMQSLLKYFAWSTVAVVRDVDSLYSSLADVMNVINGNAKVKLNMEVYQFSNMSFAENRTLLLRIKNHARSEFEFLCLKPRI